MTDHSPPPRAGYTKTGHSIKAVKRYYAQKNASRKKKSPDDEKLSKRIAAELKTQQEANKRRNRQDNGNIEKENTERSSLPIIMQTREIGPTFVTSPKSVKSAKSTGTVAQTIIDNPTNFIHNFSNSSNGCLVTCLLLGMIYVIAWPYYQIASKNWNNDMEIVSSSINSIKWIAITSICMILTISLWFAYRDRFICTLLSLISVITCSVSLVVHLVYYIVVDKSLGKDLSTTVPKQDYYLSPRNPLNFWLSITFILVTLIAISIMIKQLLNLVSKSSEASKVNHSTETENGPHSPAMSQYLAPG